MTFFTLLPLAIVAAAFASALAGALAARHVRHQTSYAPRVLATAIIAAAVTTTALIALMLPVGIAGATALLWVAHAYGAATYARTRWGKDNGVGELGATERERGGVRQWARDRRDPDWREDLNATSAGSLLTADRRRAILGPEVARVDHRPTGELVSVKLGAMNPGPGGNSGVVGLLLGRPESGKTTTAIRLLQATAAADPGGAIIILDPKGDVALREAGRQIARAHQTSFWEWSQETPLDPLASTVASRELANHAAVARIMASQDFTEEYYKGVAQDAYTDAAQHLTLADLPLSLNAMADALTLSGGHALVKRMQERGAGEGMLWREEYERVANWFKAQDARSWQNLAGAASRLRALSRSGLGAQFQPHQHGGRTISDLASRPGVSYLYLDAGMWPDAALQVAELLAVGLMQDVGRIAASSEHTITMFIDEVSAIPAKRMDAMLQRGRSAGFSVYLAAQTLAGIGAVAPELVSQITGTLSWLIGHASIGQSEAGEDDAERIGRLAGSRIEQELTRQTSAGLVAMPTGMGSQRQVDGYILHPNLIRSLPRGHAVVVDIDQPTTGRLRGRLVAVTPYRPRPSANLIAA